MGWHCVNMILLVGIWACSAAPCAAADVPPDYVAAREVAEQLSLSYKAYPAPDTRHNPGLKPRVEACLLQNDRHRVSLHVGIRYAIVDAEVVALAKQVVSRDGDLYVPRGLVDELARRIVPPRTDSGTDTGHKSGHARKVVIDPGHGGRDSGAVGRAGLKEKEVNLDVSRRVAALLRRRHIRVVMTRNTDVYPTLDERVALANREQPDAFVSIHTNAVERWKHAKGFLTLYPCAEPKGRDAASGFVRRGVLAARHQPISPGRIGAQGRMSRPATAALHGVLIEECLVRSREMADHIQKALFAQVGGASPDRGAREDDRGLRLMRNVRAPAVIVEVGFLSDRHEERRLKTSAYRRKLAEGIAQGIVAFLESSVGK